MATGSIIRGISRTKWDRAASAQADRAAVQAIRLVFDRTFYLMRYADVAASGLDPLDHFLTAGLREGRSPCVLFDPDFYLRQPGAPATSDQLFLHYLKCGIAAGIDPHPLLDVGFYGSQIPVLQAGTNPLIHLLGAGRRENRRPNPLFDAAYYRRRQKGSDHAPHPLIHYATSGWVERLQPHPLFDPSAYLEARPDVAAAGVDPLAHYLHVGRFERTRPNWLFDADHYVAGLADDLPPEAALLHYAAHAAGPGRSPHPLFDAAHYVRQHPDLARSGEDPFLHFLEFGLAANQDPHPLFDSWFYRSQNRDVAESGVPPFVHYVRHGAREGRDPNPFFPAAIYLVRHPEAADEAAGPLAHFLATPKAHLEPLCDAFDPDYYRACHPGCLEAAAAGTPPLSHYLSIGRAEQLSPIVRPIDLHPWVSPAGSVGNRPGEPAAAPILLVLHEAAHSDAARCALEAVRQMAADDGLCCRVVIRRDGPLSDAFAALAPTLVIHTDGSGHGTGQLADILYSFRDVSPDGVVMVASASMPDVVALVARLRLRLLAWLHEMPLSIDSLLGGSKTMRALEHAATRILTGSVATRDALVERYALAPHQVAMVADGVAAPRPVNLQETRRALRDRLGLPPDALVVVGSGGIEFRSGTDLFIRAGHQVVSRGGRDATADEALRQLFFVWTGPADDPLFAALCRNDIDRLGLSSRIRLLEPQDEPGQLLQGADLFLLTARDATAGTAVLEALSGGLPVVGFADYDRSSSRSGRVIEVPYLDVDAMVDAMMTHASCPARHRRDRQPHPPAGPSWSEWHLGVRQLLAESYGIPLGGTAACDIVTAPPQAEARVMRSPHRPSRRSGGVSRMPAQVASRSVRQPPAAAATMRAD